MIDSIQIKLATDRFVSKGNQITVLAPQTEPKTFTALLHSMGSWTQGSAYDDIEGLSVREEDYVVCDNVA